MFIGFVKFEIKQWFSAYQDQVCAWFSLARLPTEMTTRDFFLDHFLKETALFLFQSYSMLRQDFFCKLSFARSRKILSKFSKLSTILKHRR